MSEIRYETNNETPRSQHNEKRKVRARKAEEGKGIRGEDQVLNALKGTQQCTPPSLPV